MFHNTEHEDDEEHNEDHRFNYQTYIEQMSEMIKSTTLGNIGSSLAQCESINYSGLFNGMTKN